MSKGKPRTNPNKEINAARGEGGDHTCYYNDTGIDEFYCECGAPKHIVRDVCHGNPYNCVKVKYRQWAGKPNNKAHPQVREV